MKISLSSKAKRDLLKPNIIALCVFVCVQEGEDAVQFANRVKAAIARKGGLADLLW